MQKRPFILTLLAGLAMSGTAQAALHDRGGGMIYDDVQNLTWLQDANYAKAQYIASGGALGDANGTMSWSTAVAWASNLSYGGLDDWRLPTALNQDGTGPCTGNTCTDSELKHLFFADLVGAPPINLLTSTDPDLAKFTNIQDGYYWLESEQNLSKSWFVGMRHGSQLTQYKYVSYYAWAVRTGDVAAVPEPQTYVMLLAGLGLVGVAAMRRRG